MLFDMTIQTVGYSVAPDPETEGGLIITLAVGVPMPSPPGQPPFILPMGQMKYPMQKGDAVAFVNAIVEAAEGVPDVNQSQLVITDKMPDVDVSGIERKLRGN